MYGLVFLLRRLVCWVGSCSDGFCFVVELYWGFVVFGLWFVVHDLRFGSVFIVGSVFGL